MEHAANDAILLKPLQLLWAASFEQGQSAKSRRIFQRMLQLHTERPVDRAVIHATAASLLHQEGKLKEAEQELLAAIRTWEENGQSGNADHGSLLFRLAAVYIEDERYAEARPALERAWAITEAAGEAARMDRIKLLELGGVLHARKHEWPQAEEKLRQALALLQGESRADPIVLRSILNNYAVVLRATRRRREARSIEQQAEAIAGYSRANALVDVTELLREAKPAKR